MASDVSNGPLTGLRAIEFGQLLAGPFVGTLLGDFGADVIKVEAPPARRPDARVGPPAPQRPLALVVGALAQQALRRAQPARAPRPGDRGASCARPPTSSSRTSGPARWSAGASAPSRCTRVNPGCIYARVSGYGQSGSYRDRAGFAAGGEAIAGLRYINGYPDQAPPRSGISLGDTLAAQSAFQGILHGALRPRRARRDRPGRRRRDRRRLLRDDRVARSSSTTRSASCASPPARCCRKIAPSNVYRSSDGKWVVIAANHDTLWRRLAALMGHAGVGRGPALRRPHRARRAPGPARRDDRRVGGRSTPRPSSTRSSTRPASSARRSTRPRTSTRTRGSASAGCSSSARTRCTARSPARGRAEAEPDARGVRHGARWTVGADNGRSARRSSASRPREIAELRETGSHEHR